MEGLIMQVIEDKLRKIFESCGFLSKPVDEIDIREDLSECGLNSVNLIKVIITIEDKFSMKFSDEDIIFDHFKCLKDLIEYIQEKKDCSI